MSINKTLVLCWLVSSYAYSAISTNVQWDVRTTGNDSNGGGFVAGATGTDFSQQNAAQFSGTDLASANGTTSPCTVTSATHNFVAADVGNVIHISAGTNWGAAWYSINSVGANAATLDRSCGTAASLSGGTWAEGGAFATIQNAVTVTNNNVDGAGGSIDGTINVKAGTYTLTSAITTSINYGIVFVGFNTTHGDGGTAPVVTTATNSTTLFTLSGPEFWFDNFTFTNTAVTPSLGIQMIGSNGVYIRNSSFSGFTNAINNGGGGEILIGVEIKNSTGDGYTGNVVICVGCWIHNNTGNGITSISPTVINSIVSNNAIGIRASAGATANASCFDSVIANNSSDGLRVLSSNAMLNNCVIYGNGGFGVNGPGTGTANVAPINLGRNNAYGSNTSGNLNGFTSAPGAFTATALALGDVTLTANPFTSATNFAPNATAGGGASLTGGGWPGLFPTGATTGNYNIGAVQQTAPVATVTASGLVQ